MEFSFELAGVMPLLMHRDDVEAADLLKEWRSHPDNQGLSVPGDDRSPPWTWQAYLYHDGRHLVVPSENLMVALREAAGRIPYKRSTTFKSISQSGLLIPEEFCRLTTGGRQVALADIQRLKGLRFSEQAARVQDLGFKLFVKRAAVDRKKHVRVRARFDDWAVAGSIEIMDPTITPEILAKMFELAGRYSGLFDWRPSSKKSPGPYGTFRAKLNAIKAVRKVG
jgi:hypothetical protein